MNLSGLMLVKAKYEADRRNQNAAPSRDPLAVAIPALETPKVMLSPEIKPPD